jgi:hypothetical protein
MNSKWKDAAWYAERKDQQQYDGHKVNINIGSNNVPTMPDNLDENISVLLAQLV